MKDLKKQELNIGDEVVYAPAGAYAGVSIGIIEKFTAKQVGIRNKTGGKGRHFGHDERLYYTLPFTIIKL